MTDVDNAFEDARLLIDGGRRHIDTLQASVIEVGTSDWMEIKSDGKVGATIIPKIKLPPQMKQISYDICSNLRSALDHAVYASTNVLTGHEGSGTKFPFGDTQDEAEADARRRCRNVPPEIVKLCLAFEPFKAGNHLMWTLNNLRNTKSHRLLVPVAASSRLEELGSSQDMSFSYEWNQTSGYFNPKIELGPETSAGVVAFQFRLDILIGTGAMKGQPAITIFNRMAGEVERIVSAIEAETIKLLEIS